MRSAAQWARRGRALPGGGGGGGPGGAAVQVEAEAGLRPRDRRWAGRGAQVSAERAGGERRRRGAGGGNAGPGGPTVLSVRRERRTHRYRPGARSPAPVSRAVPVLCGGAGAARCARSRIWLWGGAPVPCSVPAAVPCAVPLWLRSFRAPGAAGTGTAGRRGHVGGRGARRGGVGAARTARDSGSDPGLRRWITGHRDASPPFALTLPALPLRCSRPTRGTVPRIGGG